MYDGDRAERLAGHYLTLLEGACADPDAAVSALPLLTPADHAGLAAWNRNDKAAALDRYVDARAVRWSYPASSTPGKVMKREAR